MIGLGFKGDIVTVSKRLARNHMFPASVAEYVTEENLKKYEHIQKVTCLFFVSCLQYYWLCYNLCYNGYVTIGVRFYLSLEWGRLKHLFARYTLGYIPTS